MDRLIVTLRERGVWTSNRGGHLRFSPHLYNEAADIDVALTQLEATLKQIA